MSVPTLIISLRLDVLTVRRGYLWGIRSQVFCEEMGPELRGASVWPGFDTAPDFWDGLSAGCTRGDEYEEADRTTWERAWDNVDGFMEESVRSRYPYEVDEPREVD